MTKKKKTGLTGKKIQKKVFKRFERYEKLSYLGQFAMFMGTVQLLEVTLKNLLIAKYNYELEKIEKWTLGQTARELEKNKLRTDFISLLLSLVDCRNYVAHSLLADEALSQSLLAGLKPKKSYTKQMRFLHKSIYELEQVIVLFKWLDKNKVWG